MASSQPKIAIVGGGPGGLTLALFLHQAGVPATVYELRQRPTEDQLDLPSGSLDLHPESGLKAIDACGLTDAFTSYTSDCTDAAQICNARASPCTATKATAAAGNRTAPAHAPPLFQAPR